MTSNDSKTPGIQASFKSLSSIAPALNAASNELTQTVLILDEALKKLNIGLSAWVTFRSRGVEDWEYDDDQIGYAKVDGKWGIAIRRIWGDHNAEHFGGDGPWMFNDAPRELRLLAVDKLPPLIEALGKEAALTTKTVQEKTRQVRELAVAISGVVQPRVSKATRYIRISAEQVEAIISDAHQNQRFSGELLEHAITWERMHDELIIGFSAENRAFAELLQGSDSLKRVNQVVNSVLGMPMMVVVKVHPTATVPLVKTTTRSK